MTAKALSLPKGSSLRGAQRRRNLPELLGCLDPIADRQVAEREAVPLGEDLGDPAAVAAAPIRLVAQQAAWIGVGGLRRRVERELGLAARQPLPDDIQNRSQSRRRPASRPSGGVPSAVKPT